MITIFQKYLILLIIGVMISDASITLNGAWNHNATFYEANPIFASTQTIIPFTIAVILGKVIATLLFVFIVSTLNKEPGVSWGNFAVGSGFVATLSPFLAMCIVNLLLL